MPWFGCAPTRWWPSAVRSPRTAAPTSGTTSSWAGCRVRPSAELAPAVDPDTAKRVAEGRALTRHSVPVRTWLSRTRMDVTPFRESRDYRLLLLAGTVFYLGGMMTYVAVPYQLYDITGSNFAVGAVGIVELIPLVV